MKVVRRTFLAMTTAAATVPASGSGNAVPGRIETLAGIRRGAGPDFRIRVWLPPSYDRADRPHQVLYMLDGQYAFANDSGETNFAADRRIAYLMGTGSIAPTLIVAIDNLGEDRFLQYMPQSIYDRADRGVRATVQREIARVGKRSLSSAQFIRFLGDELRPLIDARYRTSRNSVNNAIFGASMAGVMAGAIFVEGSKSFGRGACMSPNWAIYDKRIIDHPGLPEVWSSYFKQLGGPAGRRLWLDHGTEMMDAGMAPHQAAIANALVDLGWRRGCNLQTRVYKAGHAFAETAVQMDEVLAWLLA